MRALLAPRRSLEATPQQLAATGAYGLGSDPDGEFGFRRVGSSGAEVPHWTQARAQASSVAAYRSNPMARAIIDTYLAFCVGDSGVRLNVGDPQVRVVAEEFWSDPQNALQARQASMLTDRLLMGEQAFEMMVGKTSGVCLWSPVDVKRVWQVDGPSALQPEWLQVRGLSGPPMRVAGVRPDVRGRMLRQGEVMWWASWKALLTDTRGMPFLTPVLDWLDDYDEVLSNLVDRTALARYLAWDVSIQGDQNDVNAWVAQRGANTPPPSGTIEVHNDSVTWKAMEATTGAFEDTTTTNSIMTNLAAGTGLSKPWLAEPEDANRATSLTMAEPVRRRIGAIQNMWLEDQAELVRFAVDQAVLVGRLDAMVPAVGEGAVGMVSAASTVSVTGPAIAAADAQVNAQVLVTLSQGMDALVSKGFLSAEAARVAVKKAWEQYAGVPYTSDLDKSDGSKVDDLAEEIDKATSKAVVNLLTGPRRRMVERDGQGRVSAVVEER